MNGKFIGSDDLIFYHKPLPSFDLRWPIRIHGYGIGTFNATLLCASFFRSIHHEVGASSGTVITKDWYLARK